MNVATLEDALYIVQIALRDVTRMFQNSEADIVMRLIEVLAVELTALSIVNNEQHMNVFTAATSTCSTHLNELCATIWIAEYNKSVVAYLEGVMNIALKDTFRGGRIDPCCMATYLLYAILLNKLAGQRN